ncbi:MAG: MBL fold metallo-hydrolase, partial [Candidatus Taylorbacteria bacterium]|nr:MBL fold metallo-hydrolase [Candidatus Taylorbacteria bacterium]
MDSKTSITFCSGVSTVTGANFLLETSSGSRILIDCGMIQGEKFSEEMNREHFLYEPGLIQALIVTHAHLDHVGRIPKLVKEGFKGVIYSTPETKDLAVLVMEDAAGILAMDAERDGVDPLYTLNDVQAVYPLWKTIPYHQSVQITSDISIFLKDAGHILGSSMVEISAPSFAEATEGKQVRKSSSSGAGGIQDADESNGGLVKILFTGDLGNSPAPLLRDTEEIGEVDYLVMESTYGDKNHDPKELRVSEF